MHISAKYSLVIIFLIFIMTIVIMPFVSVNAFPEDNPVGKEEIEFEGETDSTSEVAVRQPRRLEGPEKQEIVLTEDTSKQKEKLPIKTYIPETPSGAVQTPPAAEVKTGTESGQPEKSVTEKIYEPIVDKLIEGIRLAVKDMRPSAAKPAAAAAGAEAISAGAGVPLAEAMAKKKNVQPAAAPLVKIVNDVLSGPQDFTSALAKETVGIVTVGTWDEMKRKKSKFSSEIGLASIKVPKEDKPAVTLTLKECVDIAVKNHLPLQIAKKSMRLAEMRVFEARRNLLPSASMVMEESTGRVNARAYISKKTYFEGQQPIFHGGELYYNLKQTQANLEITRSDYDRIKNDLVLQVKKAYYSMAKAKENLKIQKGLSDEVIKIDDMVKKEFESNIASKLEFLNVASQSSQVKYQLASAQGDVSIAELILKQAMNIDTRDRIDVVPLPPFKKIDIDFESTLYAALVNRPEMRINALMIEYYNYGKGIARAKGMPKVDLLGQWGMAKDEYMSVDQNYNPALPFDDRKMSQQWYAGVKASMPLFGSTVEYTWTREQWPPQVSVYNATSSNTNAIKLKLFDKLDYYSDKKLAEIDYEKARQELIKIRQDVTLEVQEGCHNYDKALIQIETAANKVAYQSKDLEVTRFKRELDEVADSNVIESMIKLAQERFGYAQAVSDCHTTLATINKAVGSEDYYKDE